MLTFVDILKSQTIQQAASKLILKGCKPYVINNKRSYVYSSPDELNSDSQLALQVGRIVELRATTASGIKQLHNISKLYGFDTVHFASKNREHVLFKKPIGIDLLPFDQLSIRSLNQQNGLFLNLRNCYIVLPPTKGYRLLSNSDISSFPDDFLDVLLSLYENQSVRGINLVSGA